MRHRWMRSIGFACLVACAWLSPARAQVADMGMGMRQLAQADGGHTTVFYPTRAAEAPARIGPFAFRWAADAPPVPGNGRLIVVSHGSGGSPWVHVDLARTLVQRGFVVAVPQHAGDNYLDDAHPGPQSWVRRPVEVGRAIDLVGGDARLGRLVSLDAVGVFGGSAGGHTVLTLAGGRWSFSRYRDHCERNLERDFSSCVGTTTLLRGNWLDGAKLWLARRIIAWRFADDRLQGYTDPRIKAGVAMVPFAADFVPDSLARPRIALGLVIADKDVNQVPAYHVEAIRKACEPRCTVLMRLPQGGHGAMLSPMPPLQAGSAEHHMLADPPGFDRKASLPLLHARIADFFTRTLGGLAPPRIATPAR